MAGSNEIFCLIIQAKTLLFLTGFIFKMKELIKNINWLNPGNTGNRNFLSHNTSIKPCYS